MMKNSFVRYKLLIACLLLTAGVGALLYASRHRSAGAPKAVTAVADPLSAIPKPTGISVTDQLIAKWMEKARTDANSAPAWVNLGDALMQKVRETSDFAYYSHAEAAYHQALVCNPNNTDAMAGLAWVYGGRHSFDKSVEWANRALALDGANNIAYGIIGDAEVELGDYDAAFDHYQKMLNLRPDLASYSRGAYLLYVTGDLRKGRWLMGKAIEAGGPFAENTAWCRSRLALMLFSDGNMLAAQQVLNTGLKAAPNNMHLLAMMGRVKTAMHDYPAAIEFYRKANAVAPDHNTLAALADLYRLTGNNAEAEKQEEALEELHTRNQVNGIHDHMQIAQFYSDHARNPVEAVRLAEEHKNSKNVFEADILAWCYYQNGQYNEAKEAITRALSRRTPEAKFLYHAGMIYAKLGEVGTARTYLYQALSLNPQFSPLDAPRAVAAVKELGETHAVARNNRAAKEAVQ
ncbi:MAG TPA: tetratricopeptide repeat protein [Chthonomonadaceae bacterium]|nr:tetratricopeptide repeat protein [Chthonomonadaceae bacterium]